MDKPLLRRAAHVSNIITALLAGLGLIIAIWQIRAGEASQREASARDAYKEYLKLAIEKPELTDRRLPSTLNPALRKIGQDNLLSFYLFSAEQIFETFADDPGWQRSLQADLCGFQAGLGNDLATWQWAQHDPAFIAFAHQALRNCSAQDD
jgi:hypothetical protein